MSEFLAEAQVLITPNTAAFAATLRKQLEVAVAAAGPVVVPIAAAPIAKGTGAALAAETAVATKATTAQVAALETEAAAAERTAGSQALLAAQERKTAHAHEQATRAVGAQAASFAGLRGAVLTASSPFLVATVAVVGLSKALKEASDTTEELNKSAVVFGQSSKEIEDFAKSTANALGISEVEALRAAGIFGNLFRTIHIATPEAADMSTQLVKLAADLASFNNADPSRVLEALRSGLVGQARPLRVFGIFISQARAQQEALIETGKKHTTELTNAELVQARFNIILKDSALAQGDFARTSDRLANQSRILRANVANLGATIGTALIPLLTDAAAGANDYLSAIQKAASATDDFARRLHLAGQEGSKGGGFLSNVFHTATRNFVDDARELSAAARLLAQGKPITFGESATETLRNLNREAERTNESLPQVRGKIADLFKAFQQSGGRGSSTALNEFVLGLQKLEEQQKNGLITNDTFAAHIRNLIKQLQDPSAFKIDFKATLDEQGLRASGNAALDALKGVLSPAAANAIGLNFMQNLGEGAKQGAETAGTGAGQAFVLNLSSQVALTQATGGDSQQLAALRARLAARQKFLNSLLTGNRKVTQALFQRAAANVEADKAAIQSILDSQSSAAKSKAQDAASAAEQLAQNQADAINAFIGEGRFAARRNALQDALSRAGANDNLAREIALNKLIIANDKQEIAALKKRIDHLHLHGAALKAAKDAIAAANKEILDTRDEIVREQAQQRQAAIDVLNQKLDVRISIAQAQDNVVAEIRARRAKLAEITKELVRAKREFGKNSLAWLELKQAQAEQIAAIKALQNQNKTKGEDSRKEAAAFFFSQLQAQAGFASNLLGNLITGSTAGLVGAPSPAVATGGMVEDRLARTRTGEKAKSTPGPTAGQHQTTNDILIRILHALTRQNRTDQAPEAHHNRRVGAAIMDNDGIHGI